jgi:hypothetical protein
VRLTRVNNTEEAAAISEWEKIVREEKNDKQATVEQQLKNLQAETSYEVEVLAQNSIGWSDPNKRFFFTTSKGERITAALLLMCFIDRR